MAGIFKAYDIRGVYPSEINEEVARKIGMAFGVFRKGKVYVGCDTRESSPSLKKAFIEGLVCVGCHVVDVGVATTPLMIFCAGNYNSPSVNVTASHNPGEYNGFKFFDKGAFPLSYESGIKEIERIYSRQEFDSGEGKVEVFNPREDYMSHLIGNLGLSGSPMRVVVDCMNGAGSHINTFILEKLGLDVLRVRCKCNGEFPPGGPDPSKQKNLEEIKRKVVESRADLGFAFDGDGDRLVVVDNEGKVVDASSVFSLLVKNAALDYEELKIVHDVMTSKAVDEVIALSKGKTIVCRVGHTYISQKARENRAQLSGELSGHYYFKETFYGDDALFAGMKIIQYISRKNKPISECLKSIPVYFSNNIRIEVDRDPKKIVRELEKKLAKRFGRISTLDGVKVMFKSGWMLFRPSNTEPKISIAYESKEKKEYEKIRDIVKEIEEKIIGGAVDEI